MKHLSRLIVLSAALLVWTSQANSAEIVVNGGFETGDFSGWTLSGNTDFMGVDRFLPHTGLYAASLAPVGSLGYIGQTLPTIAGTSYTLSFALANDLGTPNEFQALWNGNPVFTLVDSGPFDYRTFAVTVAATGAETALQFGFRQDPRSFFFDDVSVVGVPEPGTGALVLMAVGFVGLRKRRRNNRRIA